MKPDAERRMLVYQEGQRAFSSGAACPYTDWRAGTWAKGKAAAENYHDSLTVTGSCACGLCGAATQHTGTKRCDRCWELEGRITAAPDLARKILASIGK